MNFDGGAFGVPNEAAKCIKSATREDMAALLAIASAGGDADGDSAAACAGITRPQFDAAVAFWRGAGVLCVTSDAETVAAEDEKPKTLKPSARTPELSGDEVEAMITESPERRSLLYECQQTMGHIFNNAESAVILSMREYLGLEDEYILLLLAHVVRRGKKSVKYAEKMAYTLYERGVDTTEALEEYLSWLESSSELEGRFRALCGMGTRQFTQKERDFFERWVREFGCGYDMLESAYSATVDAIGKFSMAYMNKVLESWHEKGEKASASSTSPTSSTSATASAGRDTGSFDTDDFFRLAVKRGLGG